MKERPILFSATMVRAIAAGTKTQTRRVVKFDADGRVRCGGRCWHPDDPNAIKACPYGVSGEHLWVREAWRLSLAGTETPPGFRRLIGYRADGDSLNRAPFHDVAPANDADFDRLSQQKADWSWRPSIFMPRWASRLTLKIVSARLERLNEISVSDAIAEGCAGGENGDRYAAVEQFKALWESINGPGSWREQWVWVAEFEKVES